MKYRISHTTKYAYTEPVPICHNLVHLAPRQLPFQTCDDFHLLVNPVPIQRYQRTDYFGNQVDFFSIQDAHFGLNVTSSSLLDVSTRPETPTAQAPSWNDVQDNLCAHRTKPELDAYQFTFASHHAYPHKAFAAYAKESFGRGRNIVEAAQELTSRIHEDFQYDPRATSISTPVEEVFEQRAGVCQDFAHFQIASFRSLGLAARYVSGYLRTIPPDGQPRLVGADASHAWIAVYCGTLGWVDFDPTNNVIPSTHHITVGWGRDYRDVCPIQGVFVGGGQHSLVISVDVQQLDSVE